MRFLDSIKAFFKKAKNVIGNFFKTVGNKIKEFFSDVKKRRIFIITSVSIVSLILIGWLSFNTYVSDYYEADLISIREVASVGDNDIYDIADGVTLFKPKTEIKAGLIFYPGGKVDYRSYAPLMDTLARNGVLCVLIEMPYNLAVFNVNAAEGIPEQFPEVETWYIGGHSLGGSMAASYLSKNQDKIDGLILLGSYSTADVTDSRVLSIYGSDDKIMNRDKYLKYKSNLPTDLTEVIIEGGNHAGFAMYGHHEGDGFATLTTKEQIIKTVEIILEFIK